MRFKALTILPLLMSVVSPVAATASGLPLQTGVYRLGSSNYIQIAAKGERLCYRGFSVRGATVASVAQDAKYSNFYRVNGFEGVVLHQFDLGTLLFGSVHELSKYTADYEFPRTIDPMLEQCLNSNTPFYQKSSGGRGER